GVGYIIGMRVSAIMMAGAILGYLIIIPTIYYVGEYVPGYVPPAQSKIVVTPATAQAMSVRLASAAGATPVGGPLASLAGLQSTMQTYEAEKIDQGLIKNMSVSQIRNNYLLFIGAGCVATAGIISMFRTLPMIIRSVGSGLTTLRGGGGGA